MLRPIASLLLPGALQSKLHENGFLYCEDIGLSDDSGEYSPKATELFQQWGLDIDCVVNSSSLPVTCSALDLWQAESSSQKIVTFCKELDDILDGGVSPRMITELCGAPGSGKTQMCMQLCIDVQIPPTLGGIGGEAVFVSTDSGFTIDRLNDMAIGCLKHCQMIASKFETDKPMQEEVKNLSIDLFLKGVHIVATHDLEQLIATVNLLRDFIINNDKIKLIVIDSFAFPFRDGAASYLERTGVIYRLLEDGHKLAMDHNLAVVVTNHLTTRLRPGKESQLVPSLGDSFGHRVNVRLMLGLLSGNRFAAMLLKGPRRRDTSANYQIRREGIRDWD